MSAMEQSTDMRICPSILNADRANLPAEIARVSDSADWLHLDVMDNIFVPNLTFDFDETIRIIESSPIPVDSHLMIVNPDEVAAEYALVGSKSVTFHLEASSEPHQTLKRIRSSGARAGLAIKPQTAVADVLDLLDHLDMLLVMTVEPGFGGQSFMTEMLSKVREVRNLFKARKSSAWLQVDGGISLETIGLAANAGADTFVAGSAVYKSNNPSEMVRKLKELARAEFSL